MSKKVIKRDGKKQKFNFNKIVDAIYNASPEEKWDNKLIDLNNLAIQVETILDDKFYIKDEIPTVEQIQDIVEEVLISNNLPKIAKSYILYRDKRSQERKKSWLQGDLPLRIFNNKYRYKDENFEEFFERVSNGNNKIKKIIKNKEFLPAGRILANRQLYKDGFKISYSNCYVATPPKDDLRSIFNAGRDLALTYSRGGGKGIDISNLRPRGSVVNNAAKTTTGAVSFTPLYSLITGLIGQKNRRGALMISLDINHPDIEEFIDLKNDLQAVTKANISVKITNKFMEAVKNKDKFKLEFHVNDTGEVIKKEVNAEKLFNMIAYSNWNTAEPGVLFWDKIEEWNLLSEDGDFEYAGVNP